jgi:AcrR family transcriptional regulator
MPLKQHHRPLGRPPASSFDDTRERIMAAAERLFARRGYDKTSTKDIAEAAKLTPPALYHYFDSKETLFVATVEDRATKLMARFEAAAASQVGALDKLCALLDLAVLVNKEDDNIYLFVSSAAIEGLRDPQLKKRMRSDRSFRPMRELLADILQTAFRNGEFDADTDIEALIDMMDACFGGMARFAGLAHTPSEHERAIEMFKCLLRGQILGGARSRARKSGTKR